MKKKKNPGAGQKQGSDEDNSQDEEGSDESSEEDEEEDEENNEENNEEESLDVPPWEELFPEDDKNTGNFDASPGGGSGGVGGGYGDQDGQLADLPTGGPAPESQGGLMSLFSGGNRFGGGGGGEGPQSDLGGGGGPPQYRQGPPPPQYSQGPPPQQYSQGPPPQHYSQGPSPPYQAVRGRTSMQSVEEPRSGGAVLYDGYRYIPVKPVQVRVPKRQAKKIKTNAKVTPVKEQTRARSSIPAPKSPSRQTKKLKSKKQQRQQQYVLVPVDRDLSRDNREIRFSRDQHGLKMESGPMFAPTEIWRWEGPGGRPLRRRENRPSGLYYAPRPQRGSASTIRFAEENDY